MRATRAVKTRRSCGQFGGRSGKLQRKRRQRSAAAEQLTAGLEDVLLRLGQGRAHGQREKPGICIAPSYRGDQRAERAVVQTNRIALAFGGKTQNAARELVRPDFAIAVQLERQPSLVKGRFEDGKRLW